MSDLRPLPTPVILPHFLATGRTHVDVSGLTIRAAGEGRVKVPMLLIGSSRYIRPILSGWDDCIQIALVYYNSDN